MENGNILNTWELPFSLNPYLLPLGNPPWTSSSLNLPNVEHTGSIPLEELSLSN
jgi:hypothetical protein